MHLGLEPMAAHPKWLLHPSLIVDDKLLRDDVDHLAIRGKRDRLRRLDDPIDIGLCDLLVLAGDRDDPAAVDPLDMASSEATLTADEKELGVLLVDIGGGTSDIAVFVDGSIRHTAVLSLGGDHLTHDIAIGLRTPPHSAEEIKRQFGCALASLVSSEEVVEVPSVGGRRPRLLSRQMLCEIVQPRMEEIFTLVELEARRAGFMRQVAAGVVVTGGSSIMEGVPELAEQIFDLPVRLGMPTGVGGLKEVVSSPMYATGVGLVLYGREHLDHRRFDRFSERTLVDKVIKRMMQWFSDFL